MPQPSKPVQALSEHVVPRGGWKPRFFPRRIALGLVLDIALSFFGGGFAVAWFGADLSFVHTRVVGGVAGVVAAWTIARGAAHHELENTMVAAVIALLLSFAFAGIPQIPQTVVDYAMIPPLYAIGAGIAVWQRKRRE